MDKQCQVVFFVISLSASLVPQGVALRRDNMESGVIPEQYLLL